MQTQTRRGFLTAGAGAVGGALLTRPAWAGQTTTGDADFLAAHLTREMQRLNRRALQQRGLTSGDLGTVATHLRLMADHPDVLALQQPIQWMNPDTVAATDLEAHRVRLSTQYGIELPLPVFPSLDDQQLGLAALQADLPGTIQSLASYLDGAPVGVLMPAGLKAGHAAAPLLRRVQTTIDHDWTCNFLRGISLSITFVGIVVAIGSGGSALIGVIAVTGLVFQAVIQFGC